MTYTLRTNEQVTLNNIDYETIELYHEEIDECFFAEEEWKTLLKVCMITAISYLTKENDDYLMMDVYGEENKNGENQSEGVLLTKTKAKLVTNYN